MSQAQDTLMTQLLQIVEKEGTESLRTLLQTVCQGVLEAEMTQFLQAQRYERTAQRRGYRNGYKPRTLTTRLGTLELQVPQDREGRFSTQLFDRYQRSEQALLLTLQQMYLQGVSTRKVREITETLCEAGFSAGLVSELMQKLDGQLQAWRERPLTQPYPYLVVDARYEHVRVNHQVQSWGVLLVKGVRADGHREILSVATGNSENETTWAQVFQRLWERGLRGVIYGVSDEHAGLRAAVDRYFQGGMWQRCQVHYQRNAQQYVPARERAVLAARLRDVFNAPDLDRAVERLQQLIELYRESYPQLANWLEATAEDALTVFALPPAHRVKMRSTNGLEAFNGVVDRRTQVVRIFPDERSCLRLVSALAMEQTETWLTGPRYLGMTALAEWTDLKPKEIVAA
ncbi:IS256 family transposase [Candidatus Acetothermia bacterium]|nr:IS256 family transposase [Candidatus Acetothermia bacterium]